MSHQNNFNGFDISCHNGHNGEAKALVSGGAGSYNYEWSNSKTTSINSGLSSGTYSVTVRDINGCSRSEQIVMIEPPLLNASSIQDNPVSCFGLSDAQVSIGGVGGVEPYLYSADRSTWVASNHFSNLSAGVKDFYLNDANKCEVHLQQNISQPDELKILFKNRIDAQCNDPVGSVQAVVTGGNVGYNYEWVDHATNQFMNSGPSLIKASAGIYDIEVTDAKRCSISANTYISSIGGPTFNIYDIHPVICYGDSSGYASLQVYESIPPYNVLWSDGQKTEHAIKLKSGTYFATVEDGIGCKTVQQVLIPTPEPLDAEFIKTPPLCFGDGNGMIQSVISGGTSPYKYNWINPKNTTDRIANLHAGSYELKVQDLHGCSLQEQTQLLNPELLKIEGSVVPPTCLGRCDGTIAVEGSGGSGAYNFVWKDGTNGSELANVCPGNYTVVMKDGNDCKIEKELSVAAGKPLSIDLGSIATLCTGQSKFLDPGSQWVVSNWTSTNGFGSTEQKVVIKNPGTYFFEGIDDENCVALDTFKLETSLDLLKAEFLIPANSILGDTLVAIDISWPLPEKIEWNYPPSFKLTTSSPNGILYVQPQKAGVFTVGMKSFLAECQDMKEKTITILANESDDSEGGRLGFEEELIKEFSLSPNPNDGKFLVKIELREIEEIKLRVVQYPAGVIVTQSKHNPSLTHNIDFILDYIPQGLYVLLLDVKDQQRFIRFLKR